ncbi:MAG TPA: hypothetical protein VD978_19945 [Azospirillum sp.]|nr:hypothetical protein [Azospirillum sp.]
MDLQGQASDEAGIRRQMHGVAAVYEHTRADLVAFVEATFVSILSRRLKRLAVQDVSP